MNDHSLMLCLRLICQAGPDSALSRPTGSAEAPGPPETMATGGKWLTYRSREAGPGSGGERVADQLLGDRPEPRRSLAIERVRFVAGELVARGLRAGNAAVFQVEPAPVRQLGRRCGPDGGRG